MRENGPITILEGSTFCVADPVGDIVAGTAGLFAEDTRYLSRLVLTVNGHRPLLLANGRVEYFSASFWLRNPVGDGLGPDEVSLVRNRFVGDLLSEQVGVVNHSGRRLELELGVEIASDFADIFTVKAHDFALGDPQHTPEFPDTAVPIRTNGRLVIVDPEGVAGETHVIAAPPGRWDGSALRYPVALDPGQRWELRLDIVPRPPGGSQRGRTEHRFGEEPRHVAESLAAWRMRVPRLESTWDDVRRTFACSVSDLASLRIRGRDGEGDLPAAGMPWFMCVFGRDTLITSLQTLMLGPELAEAALRALAGLQADRDDPQIDAEPGKIVHEVRHGKGAIAWFPRYYGTVDATPLFLILLSEVWRWTDDSELVQELKEPALAALRWIDEYGDLDGDGFVEFQRRSDRGLAVQSWKDSHDSQRYADGRVAQAPIAPCEVQGYVYDAKLRLAELARTVWGDAALGVRLERDAASLRDRFDAAFWCPDRGGYYALALDRDKRRVDALCSNIGHLLWSGIVPERRVDAVVDRLMGHELWSGWGVRTMSIADAGFSPLAYHNGTVWPHDNSLIAQGLARYGRWTEAHRIVRRLISAAIHFDYQLPEVFAGFPRAETPFPIPYPTATRPQAWAAGAPILLLQILLGLEPDRAARRLCSTAPAELPTWVGSLQLSGVKAFGRPWDVSLDGHRVSVEPSERQRV